MPSSSREPPILVYDHQNFTKNYVQYTQNIPYINSKKRQTGGSSPLVMNHDDRRRIVNTPPPLTNSAKTRSQSDGRKNSCQVISRSRSPDSK